MTPTVREALDNYEIILREGADDGAIQRGEAHEALELAESRLVSTIRAALLQEWQGGVDLNEALDAFDRGELCANAVEDDHNYDECRACAINNLRNALPFLIAPWVQKVEQAERETAVKDRTIEGWVSRYDTLDSRVSALRDGLRKYGKHRRQCWLVSPGPNVDEELGCTCGLDTLLGRTG